MTTRTVIDIIKRAYRLIGVYSIGETPTADEAVDGQAALNAMLDEWAAEGLMTYAKSLDTINLVANTSVYTLGATGTIVTVRPNEIDQSSYIEYLGVSYPMSIATLDDYNSITLKGTTSTMPFLLWYKEDYPNGTLTVFPTPILPLTLKLWSIKPVSSFNNLTDLVSFPPAYENAITYNLACILAVEFGMPIPNLMVKYAALAKKKIKRQNYEPVIMDFRSDIPQHGVFNMSIGMVR